MTAALPPNNGEPLSPQPVKKNLMFKFTGRAGEYFGIWFMNGFLTFLTLGIYGPWAKVRKMQYFYNHTELANGSFQFLANPFSMLKSRLIALLLFVGFIVAEQFVDISMGAALVYGGMIILYLLLAPVFLVLMMSFRLRYSAWRNVRFSFNKDFGWAYRVYLAPNAYFAVLILCVIAPFWLKSPTETAPATELQTSTVGGVEQQSDQPPLELLSSEYEASEQESYFEDDEYAEDANDYEDETGYEDETDYETEYSEEEYYSDDSSEYDEEEAEEPSIFDRLEKSDFIPAWTMLVICILLMPYFDFINTRFLAMNARFGTSRFRFTATAKDYYRMYAIAGVPGLLLIGGWLAHIWSEAGGSFFTLTLLSFIYILIAKAYMATQRYNLVFNKLLIGRNAINASARTLPFLRLSIFNYLGRTFSAGLLNPWADIRTAKFFLDATSLKPGGDLTEFLGTKQEEANALAEEIADVFDLDL